MSTTIKSLSVRFLLTVSVIFILCFFVLPLAAEENPQVSSPQAEDAGIKGLLGRVETLVDPNDWADKDLLVYDPDSDETFIIEAMKKILGRELDPETEIRNAANPVTLEDLATHDILIVGWNNGSGNISGLNQNDLAIGITGRVLLSGHDLGYHTGTPDPDEYRVAAKVMLIQAIDWVLSAGGCGLITLGNYNASGPGFPYLPEHWDVDSEAFYTPGELVKTFTPLYIHTLSRISVTPIFKTSPAPPAATCSTHEHAKILEISLDIKQTK